MARISRFKHWRPSQDNGYRQTEDYSMGYAVGKVTEWKYEPGADNKPQAVLPGAERRSVAQLKANQPLRPSRVQKPCDHGLFSDDADQLDFVEMFMDSTEEE
jgi:hypothetical protein